MSRLTRTLIVGAALGAMTLAGTTAVARAPADPVAFTKAKHDWITATLAHLGLAGDQPRRLYQDDLDPDSPTGAHRPPTAPPRPATLVL
jgi:hypothetical protein